MAVFGDFVNALRRHSGADLSEHEIAAIFLDQENSSELSRFCNKYHGQKTAARIISTFADGGFKASALKKAGLGYKLNPDAGSRAHYRALENAIDRWRCQDIGVVLNGRVVTSRRIRNALYTAGCSDAFRKELFDTYSERYECNDDNLRYVVESLVDSVERRGDTNEGAYVCCKLLLAALLLGPGSLQHMMKAAVTPRVIRAARKPVVDGFCIEQVSLINGVATPNKWTPYEKGVSVRIGRDDSDGDKVRGTEIGFVPDAPEDKRSCVSRKHAMIECDVQVGDVRWLLVDTESKNGTAVARGGQEPIIVTAGAPVLLEEGDEIWLAPEKVGQTLERPFAQGAVLRFGYVYI